MSEEVIEQNKVNSCSVESQESQMNLPISIPEVDLPEPSSDTIQVKTLFGYTDYVLKKLRRIADTDIDTRTRIVACKSILDATIPLLTKDIISKYMPKELDDLENAGLDSLIGALQKLKKENVNACENRKRIVDVQARITTTIEKKPAGRFVFENGTPKWKQ